MRWLLYNLQLHNHHKQVRFAYQSIEGIRLHHHWSPFEVYNNVSTFFKQQKHVFNVGAGGCMQCMHSMWAGTHSAVTDLPVGNTLIAGVETVFPTHLELDPPPRVALA